MKPSKSHNALLREIRGILEQARQQAATAVNSAMVFAYWEIGKRIVQEEQKGSERAAYGNYLLRELSKDLSDDFGKSFDARELRRIRQFYLSFPIRDAVRPELSWTHYRLLIRVENESIRNFYVRESIGQHCPFTDLSTGTRKRLCLCGTTKIGAYRNLGFLYRPSVL